MANIGTKNGSNGRERDFVKRQERAKGKVHDNGRTGVVKRRVQAPVQPNACKRRHGACGGKRVGKPPFTDINHRTGKGADPKGNIDH